MDKIRSLRDAIVKVMSSVGVPANIATMIVYLAVLGVASSAPFLASYGVDISSLVDTLRGL